MKNKNWRRAEFHPKIKKHSCMGEHNFSGKCKIHKDVLENYSTLDIVEVLNDLHNTIKIFGCINKIQVYIKNGKGIVIRDQMDIISVRHNMIDQENLEKENYFELFTEKEYFLHHHYK